MRNSGLLRHHCSKVVFGLLVLCPAGFISSSQAQDDLPLRYGWKQGQTLSFHVQIDVDHGDYSTILAGYPSYKVRKADEDGVEFSYSGLLSESKKAKPGKRIRFRGGLRSPFSPFTGVSPGSAVRTGATVIKMNARGEIISKSGSSQLPFLLGNLSELMLELLPEGDEKSWNESTEISISLSNDRFPRPRIFRENKNLIKAKQVTTYTLKSVTAETATLMKEYRLRTIETVKGKPRFEIVGSGTVTFDRKLGSPAKLDYKQTVVKRDANNTEETPLTVSYRLLSEEERVEIAKSREVAIEGLTTNKNAERKNYTPDELAQLVVSLQPDSPQALKTMLTLQRQIPGQPHPEIAEALEEFLKSEKDSIRYTAMKTLELWATNESQPALLKSLDDSFAIVRHSSMIALARLNDEATAEAIAKRLAVVADHRTASRALQAMGENAEDAVLGYAESKEWQTRLEVVRILKTIGTKKSLETLQKLEGDENALVKRESTQAIKAIEDR